MRRVTILVLFLLVSLTWGTTWLAMRIAAETIPPVFATGMRFMFAAPFLIGIAWLRKTPLLFPRGQRLFQLVICIFYFAIPFSLMIYGETYVSSGLASIIFSNPYFSSDCGKPGKLCIWICNFNSINALYYTVSCRDISYSFLTASVCNQQTSGLLTTNK